MRSTGEGKGQQIGSTPKRGRAAGLSLSILCWSSQAGHRHSRPSTQQQIRETPGVPTLLLSEALAAHKRSCRAVWWASLSLTHSHLSAPHSQPHRSSCGTHVLFQQVPVWACPLARGRPLVLGSWGVWSHCSGQTPSGAVGGCSEARKWEEQMETRWLSQTHE